MRGLEPLEGRGLFAATLPAGFSETILATGLNQPTSLVQLPDGRLLVSQKTGAIRVIRNGTLLTTPALTLSVDSNKERGLLSVEADPNFTVNRYIYVNYFPAGSNGGRISRFTLDADTATLGSETVLLDLDPQAESMSHAAGAIHFGRDGKLYIATGDNQNPANAQSLATTHGKLLRVNADGSIPTDNPFYNILEGKYRAIYSYGLRNPFTFAVDSISGKIFLNDVGEKSFEEIDLARSGANFGWPNSEGPTENPDYDTPFYSYPPLAVGVGVSITGGAFYTAVAQQFPASYSGGYFFGDYVQGTITSLDLASKTATPFASGMGKMIDLDVAPDGTLLATTYDGVLHAIKYLTPTNSARISGFTFNDADRSGTFNAGDSLAVGKTVFLDADNDGVLDAGEKSVVTDANGNYAFAGLAAGTYRVRRVFPTGYQASTPPIDLVLTAGQVVAGQAIGSVTKSVTPPPPPPPPPGKASIAGFVVNDVNGDSKWTSGELGLAGRTVWIDADNDGLLDSNEAKLITDSKGTFKFTGLAAGTYKVRQLLPTSWQQTSPANGFGLNIVLTNGQAKTGQTFLTKLA